MAQSVLSDGFINLCISDDANWLGEGCRVLIEGQITPDATAEPDEIIKVSGLRDLETRFGLGSVLTESIRTAMCACPSGISIYALPRLDQAGAVKATYLLTITTDATVGAGSDGRATIFWGNSTYNIDVNVSEGDTDDQIAAAIHAAISPNFPFTATVLANVITLVAKNGGTIGNGLIGVYNWQNRLNYAPEGVTATLTQTVVGSVNPVVDVEDYGVVGECCYSCYILSSDDLAWQNALRDHIRSKWSCDTPQCFGHGYVYNRGTLGQVLAAGDNSPELSRMAICADEPIFPYLKNANFGALSCCVGCENPEVSIQGQTEGLLECVAQPQTCDACWLWDEIVQLKESGFVVTGPSQNGSGALSNPYVYNDVTNYLFDGLGRDNLTWRNTNSRRLATATALSLAEQLQTYNGLGLFGRTTAIKQGVKGTNQRLMLADIRAWARGQIGELFSEFDNIDSDIRLVSAAELQNGCNTSAGRLYLFLKYRPPIRIEEITVDMSPQLLQNCER